MVRAVKEAKGLGSNPSLPLTSCGIWDKSYGPSVPQFPCPYQGMLMCLPHRVLVRIPSRALQSA